MTPSTNASFELNQLLTRRRVGTQARGDIIRGPEDVTTERTGQWVLFLNNQNVIKGQDIRNGSQFSLLAPGVPCKGICFNRESDKFIVGQFIGGVWYASEYNFPAMTFVRQWELGSRGIAQLNTLRYTVNNRYLMIGHSGGCYLLNTFTGNQQLFDEPLVGNIVQFECLTSMYAFYARTTTQIKLTQINTGRSMLYLGDAVWDELSDATWNWEVDETTPIPHLLLGLRRGNQWFVEPFKMQTWDWYNSKQFSIACPSKPLAMAFSEVDNSTGTAKESTFGTRCIVIFYTDRYRVHNALSGELIAEYGSSQQQSITAGFWKEAQGLYL